MSGERILIVEDDPAILTGLREKLTMEGYDVVTARDGDEALSQVADTNPELLVLDLMLPGIDGLTVLRRLRGERNGLPVLILSAKGREQEKVEGLRAGADDYLAKPFGLSELLARIEALLRRATDQTPRVRLGDIEIEVDSVTVSRGDEEIPLSRKELDLMRYLLRHRNCVVSRDQILDAVWGLLPSSDARAVDYHILNLRRKLEQDPTQPRYIVTRHGLGYQLNCEVC